MLALRCAGMIALLMVALVGGEAIAQTSQPISDAASLPASDPLPSPSPISDPVTAEPQLPSTFDWDTYLPNGSFPTDQPAAQNTRLVLSLGDRRVYLYRGEAMVASYPVAIGHPDTPTPLGNYEVFQMVVDPQWQSPWTGEVHPPGPDSALGLRWIGFAQMSNGVIGFHGTPTVSSIGQAASNGCVRMYNEDVVALYSQITIGTPVSVIP